jgi:16S rRNA G966 N2-methylase RsmD
VFYDFNYPTSVDANLRGLFDVIVIDPPFISPSVWESYAITVSLLAKEGAHIICTTVAENEELIKRLFMCQSTKFQPSIPNLTYQYNTYANFESNALATTNAELE